VARELLLEVDVEGMIPSHFENANHAVQKRVSNRKFSLLKMLKALRLGEEMLI
jgi:hypothetical protein